MSNDKWSKTEFVHVQPPRTEFVHTRSSAAEKAMVDYDNARRAAEEAARRATLTQNLAALSQQVEALRTETPSQTKPLAQTSTKETTMSIPKTGINKWSNEQVFEYRKMLMRDLGISLAEADQRIAREREREATAAEERAFVSEADRRKFEDWSRREQEAKQFNDAARERKEGPGFTETKTPPGSYYNDGVFGRENPNFPNSKYAPSASPNPDFDPHSPYLYRGGK